MVLTRREGGLKPDLSKLFDLFPSFYRATCEHPMKFSAAMVMSSDAIWWPTSHARDNACSQRIPGHVPPFLCLWKQVGRGKADLPWSLGVVFYVCFFFFFLTLHLENIFMCLLPNLKLGIRIVSDLLKSRASSGTRIHQTTPSNTFPKPPEMTPRPQGRSGSREWHRSS